MAKLLPVNPMNAAVSAPSQVGVPPESHVTPAYAPTADAVAMAVSTVAPLTPIAAPHIPKTKGQATMMIAPPATTATAATAAAIHPFSSGLLEFNQHDVASLTPHTVGFPPPHRSMAAPVGSVYRVGLFVTYGYRFSVCGAPRAPSTGSIDVNRPVRASYCRARRYVRPDSRSLRSPRNRYRSVAASGPETSHARPNGSYDAENATDLAASVIRHVEPKASVWT